MEETRVVNASWELSTYKFRIEGRGLRLMLDGMKQGRFKGIRCHKCGMVYLPGPFYCRKCHVKIDEPVEIGDHGTIKSFTAVMSDIRGNPLENPMVTVMVKLDGCDSWIMGNLLDVDWRDVKVGMRVKIKWKEEGERTGTLQDMEGFALSDN
jgi:hypothetical protein